MPYSTCEVEPAADLERPWQRALPRAPRGDQQVAAIPPLNQAGALLSSNLALFAETACDVSGMPLAALRDWARQELLAEAARYTADLLLATGMPAQPADGLARAASRPLIASGHQPALFHAGVWVKNFAVGALARREQGTGVHLVVDNDVIASRGILVPTGPVESPGCQTVLFDDPRPDEPWEEARVANEQLFSSFAERAMALLDRLNVPAMLPEFWRDALRAHGRLPGLACCLTAARRAREERFGTSNLELPMSRVCQSRPFLWFAAHLLWNLPRFHQIYNDVVAEYRQFHGIRSPAHPVPDLRCGQGWLEAPFWIWNARDQVRRRLAARWSESSVELVDRSTVVARLPPPDERGVHGAVEVLSQLESHGLKLRTRALTTTLFARLCLADLFIHGIGGARYDEIADRIIARFWRIRPPEFLTLSATVHLPVEVFPVTAEDARRCRRLLRELDYNSDRYLPPGTLAEARPLVEEKRFLAQVQRAARRGRPAELPDARWSALPGVLRFHRFRELNRLLANLTQAERQRLQAELARTTAQLAANALLQGREYAFCLHSAEKLRRFFEHACASLG